jgi:hypothetical protein
MKQQAQLEGDRIESSDEISGLSIVNKQRRIGTVNEHVLGMEVTVLDRSGDEGLSRLKCLILETMKVLSNRGPHSRIENLADFTY